MKKIEELNKIDWQDFLDRMFDNTVEYSRTILSPNYGKDESCGIEYLHKSELISTIHQKNIISFSNPELISWLYEHEVDLTLPLKQLKYDFIDLDETNSVLFEFVMGVNKVMKDIPVSDSNNKPFLEEMGPVYADELNLIRKLQRELISKL